jgi:nucleoside diphosphate kinase
VATAIERTLVIVKPDGVQRGLVGEIVGRLERRGLKIVAMRLRVIDGGLAERHYAEHIGKAFYPALVSYIGSGPSVVFVLEGPDAIAITRATVGSTRPAEAAPDQRVRRAKSRSYSATTNWSRMGVRSTAGYWSRAECRVPSSVLRSDGGVCRSALGTRYFVRNR